MRPFVRPVVLIAVAFDSKAHIACTLNYHIDPVGSRFHLGDDPTVSAAG